MTPGGHISDAEKDKHNIKQPLTVNALVGLEHRTMPNDSIGKIEGR